MNTKRITVDLDHELYRRLRRAAADREKSMSDITREALETWLREYERQDQ